MLCLIQYPDPYIKSTVSEKSNKELSFKVFIEHTFFIFHDQIYKKYANANYQQDTIAIYTNYFYIIQIL